MALTLDAGIKSILKTWYEDKVESLLFRNSPTLKTLNKVRVEGKEQAFAAISGAATSVGADFLVARAKAASASKNVEFRVTPGKLFAVYSLNTSEVQASVSKKGAYMEVAANKMFASTEGFRKTLAAALFGRGYGEIGVSNYDTAIVANTAFDITMENHAIMKIDVGTSLDLKATIESTVVLTQLEVQSINGNIVTVLPNTSVAAPSLTDVLCIAGSMIDNEAGLPMGLDGWLPTVGNRTGAEWATYIARPFFGVNRADNADRLAGAFYRKTDANEKYSVAVQKLLAKVRRQGSEADLIIMNDEDFLTLSAEIETTNTYFTQTSTKSKKDAVVGMNEIGASFSTSFIENIYDDPYCPKGRAYILDKTAVKIWSYTNAEKIDDGIAGNNAGKQDPMVMDGEGKSNTPYGLVIDDYLNIQPGVANSGGPSMEVTLQFIGSFVVTNPSNCGVVLFN